MVIKFSQTTKIPLAQGTVWDYPMPNEHLGISYQEHNGRVPQKGWGVNTACLEEYFIIDGKARVFIDNKEYEADKGDIIILEPGQKSYLIADHLKLLTITRPPR